MSHDPANDALRKHRKVRLIEVAEEAGVSRAAASLAMRGDPSIPLHTRERIRDAARSLGYVYNRGAANLRTASTQSVGMVVHDVTNPYFAEIVAAIQDEMTRQGRIVLFGNTRESPERQAEFIEAFREHNVDGIFLCPAAGTDPATVLEVQKCQIPLVIYSRDLPEVEADYVGADNLEGMQTATEHLISLGHRRIAMIGVNRDISTGRDRFAGYRAALSKAGIEEDPEIIFEGPATRDFGMRSIRRLVNRDRSVTACVCFNDIIAFGVMLGLRHEGKEAGEDFSVVGFDDIVEATLWQPALTSLGFCRDELGRHAASLLMRRISDPTCAPKRIILPNELRKRASTQSISV